MFKLNFRYYFKNHVNTILYFVFVNGVLHIYELEHV